MNESTEPPAKPAGERYRVQSLGRALDMSKAAVYALLQTLLSRGFLSDMGEGANRRYRLGLSLARLGDMAVAHIGLTDVALPELRKLTADLGMTSRIAIFEQDCAVVIGRVDAP